MIFENPVMLLLIPVVIFVIWFSYKRKNRGGVILSSPDKYYIKSHRTKHWYSKGNILIGFTNFFFWVSLLLIAFSFSAPEVVKKDIKHLSAGNDFFILLDVSPSMAIEEDVASPAGSRTRLDKAKEAAEYIVMNSGNDYPGLILFGSDSVVSVLPTPDRKSFLHRLQQANIMDLGEATAIGTAIGTAIHYLKDSKQKEKSIILISDGGANYGELSPLDASIMAANLDIRINCIAIGNITSEKTIIIDTALHDRVTARISGSYHPEILKKIAENGRGYFLENPVKETIGRITASLKTGKEETEIFFIKKDLSGYFFIPGFFILLIAMFLKIMVLRELMA
ncbi:MAG: VWA domain-containing protein [Spirochaetaceae bacterium]|nr:VWA domain-containing protein [Spirochaetaceae bacterium]